jgi:hypothetical protein
MNERQFLQLVLFILIHAAIIIEWFYGSTINFFVLLLIYILVWLLGTFKIEDKKCR